MTDAPLRVLYIMHNAAPGGAARSLRALLRALPEGAVEPTVMAPEGPALQGFIGDGIPVRHIPAVSMFQSIAGVPLRGVRIGEIARVLWQARHGRLISQAIEEVRPHIVHLNDRGMLHAAMVARRHGVPVVMHARCVADRETAWAHAVTVRALRELADCIVAIDGSVKHSLRELPACEVVYNPMMRGEQVHQSANGRPGVRVVYLGNLAAHKGIWDLLACAELLKDRTDITFRLAGGNTRPAEFYRSAAGRFASAVGLARDMEHDARKWIDERGLQQRVELLGHVDSVADVLADADILLFPSHLNGPGRSVFEAGVAGVPSIVAMQDKVADVVEDGVTGIVVPPYAPAAIAAAVTRLADDPALRKRLGEAARARYVDQFDAGRIGRQMLDLYRRIA